MSFHANNPASTSVPPYVRHQPQRFHSACKTYAAHKYSPAHTSRIRIDGIRLDTWPRGSRLLLRSLYKVGIVVLTGIVIKGMRPSVLHDAMYSAHSTAISAGPVPCRHRPAASEVLPS